MTTIDLTTPAPPPLSVLDGLPRRLPLTLAELTLAAELAGNAPLPFETSEPRTSANPLEGRLGQSRASTDHDRYRAVLDGLHDPRESLTQRGLLDGSELQSGLRGAIGLLAAPELALDLDLVVNGEQAKAWHRQGGDAVAVLGTVDGIVFELAWMPAHQWGDELARVAQLPSSDTPPAPAGSRGAGAAALDAPYELLDATGEAIRAHREDLLPVLVGKHSGEVRSAGRALADAEALDAVRGLHHESRGRLRALATRVSADGPAPVGVVSWLLTTDGWVALRPYEEDGSARVLVEQVQPVDLAAELAPVLAEVSA